MSFVYIVAARALGSSRLNPGDMSFLYIVKARALGDVIYMCTTTLLSRGNHVIIR